MTILISGSLAYDTIMDFPGRFRDHILPDNIHILNVCFLVDDISKNYGGCAGNIAYTMRLLGQSPIILSIVGKDGGPYCEYLEKQKISTQYIITHGEKLTSQASIVTDKDDNQITAYHNGASDHALSLSVEEVKEKCDFGMIVPTAKPAMIKHAREYFQKNIPFVFDPGQQVGQFSPQELEELLSLCSFYIVNDYEMHITLQKINRSRQELSKMVKTLIITYGAQGSHIITKGESKEYTVRAYVPDNVVDPTGAGDAYRAGFFSSYVAGKDLQTCGQVGSIAAAYAIEHYGTQNHTFGIQEFYERYQSVYQQNLC